MKKLFVLILALGLLNTGCEKEFLETNPTNQISDQVIFNTVEGAQTVLDGISRWMRTYADGRHDTFGVKSLDLASDLMSEDMAPSAHHHFGFDYRLDNRSATYARPRNTWYLFYRIIYNANGIISAIDAAESTSETYKNNLKAQALALRGYAYFQLIQWFQKTYKGNEDALGVPIYTEATLEGAPRAKVSEVYKRITDDLDEAIILFTSNTVPRRHISDITGNVAKGLRARVALVMQDWNTAATMAAEARQGLSIMTPAQYSLGFDDAGEQNWMWGLAINDEQSTIYASWFSHVDWTIGGYSGLGYSRKSVGLALYNKMNDADVRKQLINAASYQPTTNRNWIIPYKFSAGDGGKEFAADYVMMRPEEMLLIEAEAKARAGQTEPAQTLLKQLRDNRYSAPVTVTATGTDLIEEIILERRIELWGEGFAVQDLRRLNRGVNRNNSNHLPLVATTMVLAAGDKNWIYQIPQGEIDANPNINEENQNP